MNLKTGGEGNPASDISQNSPINKLTFRSEQERQKAFETLPDKPPYGTNVDEWKAKILQQENDIESAQIVSDGEGQTGAGETKPDSQNQSKGSDTGSEWYKPDDWRLTKDDIPKDSSFTYRNAKDAVNAVINKENYIKTLKEQHKAEMDAMAAKLTEKPKASITPDGYKPVAAPTDEEMQKVETDLETVQKEMEQLDDDDPAILGLSKKAVSLTTKMNSLNRKAIQAASAAEAERIKQQKAEEEKSKQIETINQTFKKQRMDMDSLRKQTAEFSNSKDFDTMEREYTDFALKVAEAHWNMPVSEFNKKENYSKIEVAMNEYLNKTPALLNTLNKKGLIGQEPKDLRRYLTITEIDQYRLGRKLNPATGFWEQVHNELPDLDTAYYVWKRDNGLLAKQRIEDMDRGAQEMLKAFQRPGVVEIPSGTGSQASTLPLSTEQAEHDLALLDKQARAAGYAEAERWIARLQPDDPRVIAYEKAIAALEPQPV